MLVYQFIKFVIKRGEHTVHICITESFTKSAFHFILERSSLKLSLEKFEKVSHLIIRFFVLVLSRADFKIQNCDN